MSFFSVGGHIYLLLLLFKLDNGSNVLHIFARDGNEEVVEMLLQTKKFDINFTNKVNPLCFIFLLCFFLILISPSDRKNPSLVGRFKWTKECR